MGAIMTAVTYADLHLGKEHLQNIMESLKFQDEINKINMEIVRDTLLNGSRSTQRIYYSDVDLACKITDHLTDFGFCVECVPYRGCVEFGVELIIKK